jgi:putative DNA primase/helicase
MEYVPQFKLFINTNHLPTVTDTTVFESGRVKIIPFERHFPYEEQDQGLKAELTQPENLSGILNWCLEGLRMIDETGFDAPESVRDATEEYRRSSDKIARFLEDEFEQDSLAETRTSEAYGRYKTWCQNNGFFPENSANFRNLISSSTKVVKRRPKSGGEKTTLILGYRLIPDFPEFEGRSYHNGAGWG